MIVWVVLVLLAVFGVGLGFWAFNESQTKKRLQEQGTATEAEIVDHRTVASRYGRSYSLTYRYHHQGQVYENRQRVSKDTYNTWDIGMRAPVRYLPDEPATARIEGDNALFKGAALGAVSVVVLVIVFAVAGIVLNASPPTQRCPSSQNGSYTIRIDGTPYTVANNAQGTPQVYQQGPECQNTPAP